MIAPAVTAQTGSLLLSHVVGDSTALLSLTMALSCGLVLIAAALVHLHRHLTGLGGRDAPDARPAAWLTWGLVLSAGCGLMLAVPGETTRAGLYDAWPVVAHVVVVALLIAGALVADRADVPGDPALLGGGLAVLVAGGSVVGSHLAPLATSPTTLSLVNTVAMVLGLVLALVLLHRTEVTSGVRYSLALSAALLTAAQCTTHQSVQLDRLTTAAIGASLGGAVLLCLVIRALLGAALTRHRAELTLLQSEMTHLRGGVRHDRELLHEIGSTVAGITSASRLISQGQGLSPERRSGLEAALATELARLERLLSARAPLATRPFDVGEVVGPLVLSHQARGLDVRWAPATDLRTRGNPDDLAELVNILLENAGRHGGGPVEVRARSGPAGIEIDVSDGGPGVPAELRPTIFESGRHGPASPGAGLGLAIARRLATGLGGDLALVESARPGATFRVQLAHCGDDRAYHLA